MPKVDFSQFHPLDHWPWERRCWSKKEQPGWSEPFYGGPLYHLRLAWYTRRRPNLVDFLRRHTLCYLGKHKMLPSHNPRTNKFYTGCRACGGEHREISREGIDPDFLKFANAMNDLVKSGGMDESDESEAMDDQGTSDNHGG